MSCRDSRLFYFFSLSQEQIAEFSREGYLVVGRTLTNQGLEQVRNEVTLVWSREKGAPNPSATWLQNGLLSDVHRMVPLVRKCYFDGPLVDIAVQLVGPNVKAVTCQLTFKMRGNRQAVGWHQDNGYGELDPYTAISTLTALDDTDEGNGCLWVIPRSHTRGQLLKFINTPALEREIKMEVDESQAIPVPLKAGETYIMHCWTLHKSEGNSSENRDRRILFMRYADADAVEVYNNGRPRLGRLLRGTSRFSEVQTFEADL
jgi:hypothetical protein